MRLLFVTMLLLFVYGLSAQTSCGCSLKEKAGAGIAALYKEGSTGCRLKAMEFLSNEKIQQKELDSAVLILAEAIQLAEKADCDKDNWLSLQTKVSTLYLLKADYTNALQTELRIVPVYEARNDRAGLASSFLNIANIFNRIKQSDKGIAYTRRSLPLVQEMPNSVLKAELLNKITARYFYYFQDFKDSSYADSAKLFVQEAYNVAREVNAIKEQIIALTRMSAIAESKKDYKNAVRYIDEALLMCVPGTHNRQYVTLYGDKGNLLREMGQYKEARRFADSCLYYSQEEQFPPLIANAYSLIYEIENKAGNYKDALWAMNQEKTITDSLSNADRSRAVNELEKKYNQAKNERTITELAQQKKIYLLLAIVLLSILFGIGFFFRQQSLKQKQTILEAEQRLNRARMNPHFIFNALASLQSFALQNGDTKVIAGNIAKFSRIMRETLESTYKEYISIEQEISFLTEYLDVQTMRFPTKFTYSITADNDLEVDELYIPSMILQPFVENSIEHGFQQIDYTGTILIHFSKQGNQLLITISDNGNGLHTLTEKSEHISRASQIIQDRIYLLNAKLKSTASFKIENRVGERGVSVSILLPILYHGNITTT